MYMMPGVDTQRTRASTMKDLSNLELVQRIQPLAFSALKGTKTIQPLEDDFHQKKTPDTTQHAEKKPKFEQLRPAIVPSSSQFLRKGSLYPIESNTELLNISLRWKCCVDVDLSAILLNGTNSVLDSIWYRQNKSPCGSVNHKGDDSAESREQGTECISIAIQQIPVDVASIVFTATVYTSGIWLSDIAHLIVELEQQTGGQKTETTCVFHPGAGTGTAMILARLVRRGPYLTFQKLGLNASGRTVHQLLRNPANLEAVAHSSIQPSTHMHVAIDMLNRLIDDRGEEVQSLEYICYIIVKREGEVAARLLPRNQSSATDAVSFDLGSMACDDEDPLTLEIYNRFHHSHVRVGSVRITGAELFHRGVGYHPYPIQSWEDPDSRIAANGDCFLPICVHISDIDNNEPFHAGGLEG